MLKHTLDELKAAVLEQADTSATTIFTTATATNIKAYRHNYLFGLLTVLQRRYPSVEKVLQPANFRFFAREFIRTYPSTVNNIDNYGENFADFLQERTELQELPYLCDLARLDDVRYRQDPQYQVAISHGSAELWEKLQTDTQPKALTIDPSRRQYVRASIARDRSFCLEIN